MVNGGEYSQGVREGTGVPMQSAVPSRIANFAAIEIRTKPHHGGPSPGKMFDKLHLFCRFWSSFYYMQRD